MNSILKINFKPTFRTLLKNLECKFISKLYNKENLKFQKTFKFTENKEKKKELNLKEKYFENIKQISILEKEIMNEDNLMYSENNKPGIKENKILMMKKSQESDTEDQTEINEINFSAIDVEHKNKKIELERQFKNLSIENENIKYYLSEKKGKSMQSSKEYGIIRASAIRDIFSNSFSFGNKLFNPEFYESINKNHEDKPWSIKKEEIEIVQKQINIELEVSALLDEVVNKEMKNFDIEKTIIPQTLVDKPIIRSLVSDLDQPDILLVENDLSCNYGLNLEYERLIRLSKNDDFGQKIKEDKKKDNDREEIIQEEDKNLLNGGNQPNVIFANSMNSISK